MCSYITRHCQCPVRQGHGNWLVVHITSGSFFSLNRCVVHCPKCDSCCLVGNMPTTDTLLQVLAALFNCHLSSIHLTPIFVVDVNLVMPVCFSDLQHPANPANGHIDLWPIEQPVHIAEHGTCYYFEGALKEQWYVVVWGIGYHGVLHSAKLWSSIVGGMPNAKGVQMPTCMLTKCAYCMAAVRSDLQLLPLL
jgi:hypothetical protein